ncbi:hypothetical protein AN959_12280 [Psychrobacillus sp. FJAT-21963]|nr:hypothetical protein AN959_12280 [Psychrobacillus sp. FJAT-21963]
MAESPEGKRMFYHLGAIMGNQNHSRETVIFYERNIFGVAKLGWNHDHTRPFTGMGVVFFIYT